MPVIKNKTKKGGFLALLLVFYLAFAIILPDISYGAEKKSRKQVSQPVQRETTITDSNVQASFKKAEDLLKKGDLDGSLIISVKLYDYTKEVLAAVKLVNNQYERLANDPATNQNEKEDILIKLKRIKQLIPKYTSLKDKSTYNVGYLYAKKGDTEKARKYLSEVFESAPFSTKQDSIWMKTKTLLLGLYGLEGEF